MTNAELFALFDVPIEHACWRASAESQEYLGLVTYLVMRTQREAA